MPPLTKTFQQQRHIKQKQESKLRFFNILCFTTLISFLIVYTLLVNGCTGNNLEIQKIEKERESLRTKISEEASFLNTLKIPTHIQAEIGDQMVKVKKVSYLKYRQAEVAILQIK
jgi:hypothetical protein